MDANTQSVGVEGEHVIELVPPPLHEAAPSEQSQGLLCEKKARSAERKTRREGVADASLVVDQIREHVKIHGRHLQRVEAGNGLSGTQFSVLVALRTTPGMKISHLASKLSMHKSSASNLLDKLEQRGL